MFYTGYQLIPINTYLAWKNSVVGNGYDADGSYGDQCWDLAAEFWYNIGFPQGFPQTGTNHYAYECWSESRYNNISYNDKTYFQLINNLSDVQQGDVVVLNGTADNPAGHIGFADTDYDGSGYLNVLGQNQGTGGTPPPVINPAGGTTANVNRLGMNDFLGAFRYIAWHSPTPPSPSLKNSKFKWVLYAKKLKEMRNI